MSSISTTHIKTDRLLSRIISVNRLVLANARECDEGFVTILVSPNVGLVTENGQAKRNLGIFVKKYGLRK